MNRHERITLLGDRWESAWQWVLTIGVLVAAVGAGAAAMFFGLVGFLSLLQVAAWWW